MGNAPVNLHFTHISGTVIPSNPQPWGILQRIATYYLKKTP